MRIATFPCDYTMNRAFSLENRAQAPDIVIGTCPTMVQSRSTATAYRSLLLLISLLRGNCLPMVGVQMFLKRDALECSCPRVVHTPCCLYSSCQARVCAQAPSVPRSSLDIHEINIFVHASFGQFAKLKIFRLYGCRQNWSRWNGSNPEHCTCTCLWFKSSLDMQTVKMS